MTSKKNPTNYFGEENPRTQLLKRNERRIVCSLGKFLILRALRLNNTGLREKGLVACVKRKRCTNGEWEELHETEGVYTLKLSIKSASI